VLDSRFVSIVLIDAASEKMHLLAVASQEPGLVQRLPEKVTGSRLANHVDVETVNRLKALEVVQCGIKDVVPGKNPNAQIQDVLLAPMALKSSLMGVLVVRKRDVRNEYTAEEIALVKAAATLILVVIERERWQQQCLLAQANAMALTETNRRFDEFLSIASHELRTPLTTIGGNIQLALRRLVNVQKRGLPPEDPLVSKLECVQTPLICANHRVNVQNRMISDMLDGSRIQANRFTLSTKRCNLLEIVRRAVEDQRSVTPDRTIELALPQCDTIPVVADEDRIAQVVDNYLSNALKYSPAHKPVMVRMIGTECEVRVLVRDEGPGLTPEEQRQVWERFYRSDRVDVQQALSSGGGLGLGLHICCTIIEYHKGTYGVESQPGQGSTFWFALPLASS
jgi:signal transduction histidine kinase